MNMNYKEIVNKLVELKKQDDKIDKAFKGFINSISPDREPFIEFRWVTWYLDAIEIIDRDLAKDLSRFMYDINLWKNWWKKWRLIEFEKKVYVINNKNDFIKYLQIFYKK